MYHPVLQKSPGGRPIEDDPLNHHHRRRVSREGQGPPAGGPPGDRHAALSPTQQSFNPNHPPPPPPPLQHPPGPPLPPNLQPAYAPPGASPPSALPSLAASLYSRESPAKKYYDPTMDSADASLNRRPSLHYESFPSDHRDRQYGEPRAPAAPFEKPYQKPYENRYEKPYENQYEKPYQSPGNSYSRPSPLHLPPFGPTRADNMPGSPLSPTAYSSYNRDPQPQFSSPVRPPSQDTPARKVDPMSLSSIMSGNDDPPSYSKSGESRRSSRATLPAQLERLSTPTPTRALAPAPATPADRAQVTKMANGHIKVEAKSEVNGTAVNGKARPDPRKLLAELGSIDALEEADLKLLNVENWSVKYEISSKKRILATEEAETSRRKRRRLYHARRYMEIFEASANRGKEDYTRANESKVWRDVQNAEAREEKERKKDQQRKRRRERALQQENQKREEALERAEKAEDGEEREKAIKEAEKRSKKIRQTTKLLSGIDDSKEIREVTPQNHNLEGGVMGSFQMSDDLRDSRRGSKGARMSTRPRKSKEQKQAEKDQAAAAQAAIERGEDLPSIAPTEAARLEMLEKAEKAEPPKPKAKTKTKRRGKKDKEVDEEVDEVKEEEKDEEEDEEEVEKKDKPKRKDKDRVKAAPPPPPKKEQFVSKAYNQLFESIWKEMAKRDVGKVLRLKNESTNTRLSNLRKTAQLASKEARRFQLRTNKSTKDVQARAKRSMREMLSFWKRNERDERDQRKMAERQELENAKRLEAEREAARQRRKLDFLMRQTEIYSHFIGKKVKTQELERSTDDVDADVPPTQEMELDEDIPEPPTRLGKKVTNFDELDFNDDDESTLKAAAMTNAQHAIKEAKDRVKAFDDDTNSQMDDGELNFQNPSSLQKMDVKQPEMLDCQLKEYQLKGLNWLVNLYEQGINGILADEMGLGKTVQSISVMAYLAETHNIWGPFLVIAPASTLHNWQQEIQKFVPTLKALPYWGNAKDRKVLRKFWERKKITYREDAPFHVLITSYQLVVQDAQYFQRMTWQYMILDEAQAIKSSQSSRWKSLLGFHCRNRLLLTGTPIQNNMQELWALLHFIMPTLFDSHDEFSEWFSKDIESHAQSNTKLNEDQLRRLHMILKPFMLRRIKKHVQKELGDKIELDEFCDLTYRQRAYYSSLRNKISLMDLIEKANFGDDQDTATLMNLVMQFRKVCNHPDLFERADTASPLSFSYWAETASFVREGQNVNVAYSVRNIIEFKLPRLVYRDGRLDIPGPNNQRAGWRGKALDHMMNVFSPEHITESARTGGAFSWLRFTDVSAAEVYRISREGLFQRAVDLRRAGRHLNRFNVPYEGGDYSPVHNMFNIAARADRRPLSEVCPEGRMAGLLNVAANSVEKSGIQYIEPCAWPQASAPPITVDCATMATHYETQNFLFNIPVRAALYGVTQATDEALVEQKVALEHYPVADMLPPPGQRKARFTHITVPSMRRFVSDCGKLARLDALLKQLKEGNHRVLLYFQMTRMIDLMEEYLTYRNYKYCRLDGSTKLEDRRDTVADFQTRPDIFVFLLSTRAGGLGINLTAADTVIFYDSDWNPTIDSQAMDRAHRLGQTRQVTVYRLITRGTIEERIRKRALQKEEVQRVVISGQTSSVGAASGDKAGAAAAGAKPGSAPAPATVVDFNTRSRENRTKDIALWLADDDQAEEIERREREALEALARGDQGGVGRGKKRRRAPAGTMEDMYHEGEGHFEDSAKPSGAATPVENAAGAAADGSAGPPSKRKRGISKKAKSLKQRLAIADGEVNA